MQVETRVMVSVTETAQVELRSGRVEARAWFQCLELNYDNLLSSFASLFNFHLYPTADAETEGDNAASENAAAAAATPVCVEKGACPDLLGLFRKLSQREAAEAAGAAAAARFGDSGGGSGGGGPRQDAAEAEEADRGVAALTAGPKTLPASS